MDLFNLPTLTDGDVRAIWRCVRIFQFGLMLVLAVWSRGMMVHP